MPHLSSLPLDDDLTGSENIVLDDGQKSKRVSIKKFVNEMGEVGTGTDDDNFCYMAVIPYGGAYWTSGLTMAPTAQKRSTQRYYAILSNDRRLLGSILPIHTNLYLSNFNNGSYGGDNRYIFDILNKTILSFNKDDTLPIEMTTNVISFKDLGIPENVIPLYGYCTLNKIWPEFAERIKKWENPRGILRSLRQDPALDLSQIVYENSQQNAIASYVDIFNDLENVDYLFEDTPLLYTYLSYNSLNPGSSPPANITSNSLLMNRGIFPELISLSSPNSAQPWLYDDSRFPNAKSAKYLFKNGALCSQLYLKGHFPILEDWSHIFDGMFPNGVFNDETFTGSSNPALSITLEFSNKDHPFATDLSYAFANMGINRRNFDSIKSLPSSTTTYVYTIPESSYRYGVYININADDSSYTAIKLKSMSHMFYNNRFLNQVTIPTEITQEVTDASYMFAKSMSAQYGTGGSGSSTTTIYGNSQINFGNAYQVVQRFMPKCINASHMFESSSLKTILFNGNDQYASFPVLENADYMFFNMTGSVHENYSSTNGHSAYFQPMNDFKKTTYTSNSSQQINKLSDIIGTKNLKTAAYMFGTDKPCYATALNASSTSTFSFLTSGLSNESFPALEHSHGMFGFCVYSGNIDFTSANNWESQDWFTPVKERGGFHGMFSDPVTHAPRSNAVVPTWYTEDMYWPTEEMLQDWEEKYNKPNQEEAE